MLLFLIVCCSCLSYTLRLFVLHLFQASINTINFSTIKITIKINKIKKPFHINTITTLFAPSPSRKKSKSPTNSTTSPSNYKDASKILHRRSPESTDEVLKARTAQALRAFLYPQHVPRSP